MTERGTVGDGIEDEVPNFMRTGFTCPLGKLEYTVKTHLPTGSGDLFERMVRDAGYSNQSEFVRDLLLIRLYGKTFSELCDEGKRSVLTSEVPYQDQLRAKSMLKVVGEVKS